MTWFLHVQRLLRELFVRYGGVGACVRFQGFASCKRLGKSIGQSFGRTISLTFPVPSDKRCRPAPSAHLGALPGEHEWMLAALRAEAVDIDVCTLNPADHILLTIVFVASEAQLLPRGVIDTDAVAAIEGVVACRLQVGCRVDLQAQLVALASSAQPHSARRRIDNFG